MILLDTHALIWWANEPSKLSAVARETIERSPELGVCVVSCWGLGMLVAKGRLRLNRSVHDWVRQALLLDRVALLELSPEIAVRMIVATALHHRVPLVTKDQRIASSPIIRTIW